MKSETELRTIIDIYKFRIVRDEKIVDELDKSQREFQRIYQDCGTLTHQKQIENDIKECGLLILKFKKDIKKWKKYLAKEEQFLLHLLNRKS